MRVLIGTPCGGGQVTVQYLLSLLDSYNSCAKHKQELATQIIQNSPGFDNKNPQHMEGLNQALSQGSFDIGIYTMAGESLLQRGRNHIAKVALAGGWDKLMFIDADAGWTWDQLYRIISSPHLLVAGICPLKTFPISLNYLPFSEDEKYFDKAVRSYEATKKLAEAHASNYVKVPFVGTAFMCIDTKVLVKLSETVDHYLYPNPQNGQPESHFDFFKVESIADSFLSEDWALCHRARKAGIDVFIDTDVVITHTGNHTYRAV